MIMDVIKRNAPLLKLPNGINSEAVLYAIACQESTLGANNNPRFEISYWRNPNMKKMIDKYDRKSCCSWGSWQIMYPTACELGYTGTPEGLADNETSIIYVIKYIKYRAVKAKEKAGGTLRLQDIFDAYNSGNPNDKIIPERYINSCMQYYSDYLNKFKK